MAPGTIQIFVHGVQGGISTIHIHKVKSQVQYQTVFKIIDALMISINVPSVPYKFSYVFLIIIIK